MLPPACQTKHFADCYSLLCSGISDDEKQHLRQKLGSLIDQEDAQVQGTYAS